MVFANVIKDKVILDFGALNPMISAYIKERRKIFEYRKGEETM